MLLFKFQLLAKQILDSYSEAEQSTYDFNENLFN